MPVALDAALKDLQLDYIDLYLVCVLSSEFIFYQIFMGDFCLTFRYLSNLQLKVPFCEFFSYTLDFGVSQFCSLFCLSSVDVCMTIPTYVVTGPNIQVLVGTKIRNKAALLLYVVLCFICQLILGLQSAI